MSSIREPTRLHRRDTLRYIVLPIALVLLLIIVCLAGVLLMPRRVQVGTVSNVMLMVLMLCPAVICLLPVTIAAVVGVFGMNRVHDAVANPLKQLENRSATLAEKVESTTERINRKTIDVSARFGVVHKLLGTFEKPEDYHE